MKSNGRWTTSLLKGSRDWRSVLSHRECAPFDERLDRPIAAGDGRDWPACREISSILDASPKGARLIDEYVVSTVHMSFSDIVVLRGAKLQRTLASKPGTFIFKHCLQGRKSEHRIFADLQRVQATAALHLLAICRAFWMVLDMSSILALQQHDQNLEKKLATKLLTRSRLC